MAGYKSRKSGIRRPYKVLVIVCEGEKTERIYFNNYKIRGCNLKIETPNCRDTDPVNLVKYAINQVRRYDLDFKNGDQIWCVFDIDHNTEENVSKALKLANSKIKIALTNPCFELWYFLHFVNQRDRLPCREVKRFLTNYIKNYDKRENIFDIILDNRSAAISRAKGLNDMHIDNGIELLSIRSNPSTQVFQIVEYILDIIESR